MLLKGSEMSNRILLQLIALKKLAHPPPRQFLVKIKYECKSLSQICELQTSSYLFLILSAYHRSNANSVVTLNLRSYAFK